MASSSQQTSSSDFSYEVFLSFHGNDVRTGFADHLYHALVRVGIRTFRDAEELEPGKEIASNLLAAIQQSIISIPIFSMNYGCSKWCLNELKEISECRRTRNQIVLPIFYKIEPTNVRNQTGEYAKAFDDKHSKKFNKKTVQEWRDVLQEIGKLDGRHVKESLHEGALVKEIVTMVSNKLNKRLVHLADDLVGIKSHIEKVVELLEITSEVTKIVGIYGFGGIGKTTIARAVWNKVLNEFEEYAFIEDVRENVKKFGITYLQNNLIKTILKGGISDIIDVDSGIKVIKQRLCEKKVLLILDDVDKDSHIESLIGDGGWFDTGSKIIITSRDKDILTSRKAKIYEPGVMNLDDSLKLFSRYAFKSDQPRREYLNLSKAMVEIIGRLPLALKVIGSSLFLKNELVWEDTLKELQKVPNSDVMERLKISYDGLENPEQQMFLDTACFFIGMKINIVCYIWESYGFFPHKGLDILCAKSLITIDENNELRMHDVLRDLGRGIVHRESTMPEEHSRIWSKEEALGILVGRKGTNKCFGLTIDFKCESNKRCSISKGLDAMTGLRLLQLDYTHILGDCRNSFSELRWLSWKGCVDNTLSNLRQLIWKGSLGRFALTNFCPKELVVLDLSYSEMTEDWNGWNYIKMAEKLKVRNSSPASSYVALDFSGNRFLEVLSFAGCISLVKVDPSIGHLKNLVALDMKGCQSLVDLPIRISELAYLETLILHGCKSLNKIPDNLDQMTSLTTLDISCYREVPSLPSGLTSVSFCDCSLLQEIPNLPPCLTNLEFRDCRSLQNIMLGSLSGLTTLSVVGCNSVRHISDLPSSLRSLEVRNCNSMVKLSIASGGRLRNLKILQLDSCKRLEEIEGADDELESLEQFQICRCNSFKKLPKLSCSKKLSSLSIVVSDISSFEVEGMDYLQKLQIVDCKLLKKIPYMRDSKQLRELHIEELPELREIEHLEGYESLQELRIMKAPSLRIKDISTLKNLRDLDIGWCSSMEILPDLSNLKELRKLKIWGWDKLLEIRGLDRLESLQRLVVGGCKNLERLPDLSHSNLKKLWELKINRCDKLSQIVGLHTLESLQNLWISYCTKLLQINCVGRLRSLKDLNISDCSSLKRLPDLSNLKKLQKLRISNCIKLPEIPGLDGLDCLEDLGIIKCNNLTDIHGVERLKSLKTLIIFDCSSLEKLPENLKKLNKVYITECKNLPDIEHPKFSLMSCTIS